MVQVANLETTPMWFFLIGLSYIHYMFKDMLYRLVRGIRSGIQRSNSIRNLYCI